MTGPAESTVASWSRTLDRNRWWYESVPWSWRVRMADDMTLQRFRDIWDRRSWLDRRATRRANARPGENQSPPEDSTWAGGVLALIAPAVAAGVLLWALGRADGWSYLVWFPAAVGLWLVTMCVVILVVLILLTPDKGPAVYIRQAVAGVLLAGVFGVVGVRELGRGAAARIRRRWVLWRARRGDPSAVRAWSGFVVHWAQGHLDEAQRARLLAEADRLGLREQTVAVQALAGSPWCQWGFHQLRVDGKTYVARDLANGMLLALMDERPEVAAALARVASPTATNEDIDRLRAYERRCGFPPSPWRDR